MSDHECRDDHWNMGLMLKISFILFLYIFLISIIGHYGEFNKRWIDIIELSPFIRINNLVFKSCGWIIIGMTAIIFIISRLIRERRKNISAISNRNTNSFHNANIQNNGNEMKRVMIMESVRFAIINLYWLLMTNGFILASQVYGNCNGIKNGALIADLNGDDNSYHYHTFWTCNTGKGIWKGFKVSGHVFVCTLGIVLLVEEAWILYKMKRKNKIWKNVLVMTVIGWLLSVMTITGLFYHSIGEKVLGAIFSLGLWLILGRLFRRRINENHGIETGK